MITQEVLYNVTGQSFFYDPPEGRASGTPTCAVYLCTADDTGTAETATSGVASVDSVNTTFSASAGATSITVALGTGITRGRRYLVTDVDGDREWIECISINGATVGLRQPLKNTYAASSTFQGCRISISVDSTWVATQSKITDVLDLTGRAWRTDQLVDRWVVGAAGYRLRWTYTVNSISCLGVSYADLVRYQAKNLVTALDVDRRFPGWIDRLATDYQEDQGQALIDEAFAAIKLDALGDEQVIRRIRDTQVIRDLTIYRANVLAQEAALFSGGSNAEQVKAARDLYEMRYAQLIREPKIPVDQIGGGSSAQANRLPAWRR
jgi:hypothetical protein